MESRSRRSPYETAFTLASPQPSPSFWTSSLAAPTHFPSEHHGPTRHRSKCYCDLPGWRPHSGTDMSHRRCFSAPEEIDLLSGEITRLKVVLDAAYTAIPTQAPHYTGAIQSIMDDCNKIALQLESILVCCMRTPDKANTLGQATLVRIAWMTRRSKVEGLKQQLRDAVCSLTLYLTIIKPYVPLILSCYSALEIVAVYYGQVLISSSSTCQTAMMHLRNYLPHEGAGCLLYPHSRLSSETQITFPRLTGPGEQVQDIDGGLLTPNSDRHSIGQLYACERDMSDSRVALHRQGLGPPTSQLSKDFSERLHQTIQVSPGVVNKSSHTTNRPTVDALRPIMKFCSQSCKCQFHSHLTRYMRIAGGKLGSVLISQTGTLVKAVGCDHKTCISPCTPRCSVAYYGPRWLTTGALSVTLSNPGRLNITLSFPQVLPPDSEFFICI